MGLSQRASRICYLNFKSFSVSLGLRSFHFCITCLLKCSSTSEVCQWFTCVFVLQIGTYLGELSHLKTELTEARSQYKEATQEVRRQRRLVTLANCHHADIDDYIYVIYVIHICRPPHQTRC